MAPARPVGSGFFPLDEELGLLAGNLTPHQQKSLVGLCVQMPFAEASEQLTAITGVQISEATARRQTLAVGKGVEQVQTAQAQPITGKKTRRCRCRGCQPVRESKRQKKPTLRLVMSSDGAFVPLVGGVWEEVKTLVIGEVEPDQKEQEEIHTSKLSYFSRLTDAETFGELAPVETQRREVVQAQEVAAVQDGAVWLQGMVDLHRPDAVRILDFAHAAEYVSEIEQLLRGAGAELPADWLSEQLHQLKHEGPATVLETLRTLHRAHPEVEHVAEKLAYLEKREAHMQYPLYQQQGWPIGSGIVESGNKVVMQARMKGAGMHWAPAHVNPMLALRTAERNSRWDEAWQQSTEHRQAQRMQRRIDRQEQRFTQLLRSVQYLALVWRLRARKPKPPKPVRTSSASQHSRPVRPAADHPWRRPFLAKK
jgi:hypothetical protein